ncbi:MAG: hypothetical protein Q7R52_00725 [archaeon]|nr:hypothetical protein [archaeon]
MNAPNPQQNPQTPIWNPLEAMRRRWKGLSLLATGALLGAGASGIISYDCGVQSAQPAQAEVRVTDYEKYHSLILKDKDGREYTLFGNAEGRYLSGKMTLELRTRDLLRQGKK